MNGWGLSFLRARALLTLIASLSTLAALPAFSRAAAPAVILSTGGTLVAQIQTAVAHRDASLVPQLILAYSTETTPSGADRSWIVRGLGALVGAQAISTLELALASDPAAEVRIAAAGQLGRLGTPVAEAALIAAVSIDTAPAARQSMVSWLGHFTDPGAINALGGLLGREPEPSVRGEAVYALKRIGSPAALSQAISALNDPDPRVRRAASGQ